MSADIPFGNVYDKYGSRHPLEAWLVRRHFEVLCWLVRRTHPWSVLEIGCGEGELARALVQRALPPTARYLATDLLAGELAGRPTPDERIRCAAMDATRLAVAERSVDLVLAFEVLEHLARPDQAVAEAARVTREHVILSVPWEPVWRIGNLARGRYWADRGNTPGHVQHFSRRDLRNLVTPHLQIVEEHHPLPWTVILARRR